MNDSIYRCKITLRDSRPPIWRRIDVPAAIRLDDLHRVLQRAMGWHDGHLHCFEHAGRTFGMRNPDFETDHEDERTMALSQLLRRPKDSMRYEYDFGDGWEHDVVLESIQRAEPGGEARACVLAGARACPPEDVGGLGGYARFLHVLRTPSHDEHAAMVEWIGGSFDPAAFNLSDVNAAVQSIRLRPLEQTSDASPGRRRRLVPPAHDDPWSSDPKLARRAAKLDAKLSRDRARVLSDGEVGLVVDQLQRVTANLGPGLPPEPVSRQRMDDMVRWGAVGAMCARSRGVLGLRDVAQATRIPLYRIRAIEAGPAMPDYRADLVIKYFRFLWMTDWIEKWCRKNTELAIRAGLR